MTGYISDLGDALIKSGYDPALMATDGKADALSILLSLIETCKRDPIPFRGDYESHKKSVLETIKWADIEEAEK